MNYGFSEYIKIKTKKNNKENREYESFPVIFLLIHLDKKKVGV